MSSVRRFWCPLLGALSIVCFLGAVAVPPAAACGSIRDWIHAYQEADSDTQRVNALMDISNACGDYDTRRDDAVLVEILGDGLARSLPREPLQRVFDTYRCLPSEAMSEAYGKLGGLDQGKCPNPEELGAWRVVKDDRARLRNGAKADATVIGHFMRGNIVVSTGETGEWIAVEGWNGAKGYMHASLLEPYLQLRAEITEAVPEAANDQPRSVFAVASAGQHGLVDAAFGKAQLLASEAAAQSGDKAFVMESMSGTASIDLKDQRLVFRLRLLPDIPQDLLDQRTTNAPENGIEAAIQAALPPRDERIAAEAMMDAMFEFVVSTVIGRPSDGGIPPQIYAVSQSGALPGLGEGDILAQWIGGDGPDSEAMLQDALKRGVETYSQGHMEIAFRLAAWSYTQGGIAGFNKRNMVLEIRGIPPGAMGTQPLTGSPEEMVETLRKLIKAHDWPLLARHYQVDDKVIDLAELQSGAFFHPLFPPVDGADAGGLWRYRHPFHPEAKLMDIQTGDDPDVQLVTMMLEIDQGGGTPQRMLQSFRLRKVEGGSLILPD
jgi:hypothetical protein